jgi:hypothetical protein
MRFPFILRTDHDEQLRIMNLLLQGQENIIHDLKFRIQQKDDEIDSLIQELTGELTGEAPATSKDKRVKRPLRVMPGRSGWRARAEAMSRQTIPPVKDSATALDEKVKKEGGTV